MTEYPRTLCVPALLVCCAAAAGCSYPNTDITAVNTERVGDYQIVNARGTNAYAADVCVAEPSHVDQISARLLHQLANHGHRTITLNMYSRSGAVARFEWNGEDAHRQNVAAGTAPVSCGPKSAASSASR